MMPVGPRYRNALADAVVDDLIVDLDPHEERFPNRTSILPLIKELEEELQAAIDDWVATKKALLA